MAACWPARLGSSELGNDLQRSAGHPSVTDGLAMAGFRPRSSGPSICPRPSELGLGVYCGFCLRPLSVAVTTCLVLLATLCHSLSQAVTFCMLCCLLMRFMIPAITLLGPIS